MRETKKYLSCDGLEFPTAADAARHEVTSAIPQKLLNRLMKLYAAEHGSVTSDVERATLERMATTLTLNRRNARIIRDTLEEFSTASLHLPLEPINA
jgi:hypothetical protein